MVRIAWEWLARVLAKICKSCNISQRKLPTVRSLARQSWAWSDGAVESWHRAQQKLAKLATFHALPRRGGAGKEGGEARRLWFVCGIGMGWCSFVYTFAMLLLAFFCFPHAPLMILLPVCWLFCFPLCLPYDFLYLLLTNLCFPLSPL